MRLTFNRAEEALVRRKEFIKRVEPFYKGIARIYMTNIPTLYAVSTPEKEYPLRIEYPDDVKELLAEYNYMIDEIRLEIFGMKMEFI